MALPIHLFRRFCCRMYHLAIMHRITDRRTNRQTDRETDRHYHANSQTQDGQRKKDSSIPLSNILSSLHCWVYITYQTVDHIKVKSYSTRYNILQYIRDIWSQFSALAPGRWQYLAYKGTVMLPSVNRMATDHIYNKYCILQPFTSVTTIM